MTILDWLAERWKSPSTRYTYIHFNADQIIGAPATEPARIVSGEHYYRLWLVGMSLENDRQWFSDWQPAVYSVVRFRFGDRDEIVTHITGPTLLGEQRFAQTTRRVLLNYALTPLVPFNGGDVEIEAGLLAVPGKNDVEALLQTLGDFSKLLVVPEVSTALNVTNALAAGLANLVGATEARPELRFHQTFSGGAGAGANRLRPGYFAVIGAADGTLPSSQLVVRDDVLCSGPSRESAKPLSGYQYLLFRIESSAERDDWDSLASIRTPYEQSLEFLTDSTYERNPEKRQNLLTEADRRIAAAKLAALRARELTRLVGRNQVLDAIQRGYENAKSKLGVGFGTLESIQEKEAFATAMRRRIGVTQARALGLTAERDVFPRPQRPPPNTDVRLSAPKLHLERAFDGLIDYVHSPAPADVTLETVPTADEEIVVRRTPHMEVIHSEALKASDSFTAHVYADDKASRPGEITDTIRAKVSANQQVLETVVSISGTGHFEFHGAREQPFPISIHHVEQITSVTFDVTVRPDWPADAGPPRLWAYFNYKGRPCGQVSIAVSITGATNSDNPDAQSAPPSGIAVEAARAADLTIEVRDPRSNQKGLEIWVRSPHLAGPVGPVEWSLPQQTHEFVAGIMNDFVAPGLKSRARVDNLVGAGITFFRAIPLQVQEAIWKAIDTGKLKSVLVQSAEPHIPWELMIPTRPSDVNQPPGDPLGVRYAMGRWVSGDSIAPPQRLLLKRSLIVAPDYPGPEPEKLDHAQAEAEYVVTLFPGIKVDRPDYATVADALQQESFNLCHFVCHGAKAVAGGSQTIYLLDEDTLSARQLSAMRGKVKSLAGRAFVFLNACEVGELAPSLVGADGFARSFIDLGAGAVIAPLWSVKDSIANQIAQAFYKEVHESPRTPFAATLSTIRRVAYEEGEDTYAAYCFYGDPVAVSAPDEEIAR
jgi:hypothetical protein